MRRFLLLACLLLVVAAGGYYHVVVAGSTSLATLPELTKWVGKYPSDEIDGKTMWANPALRVLVEDLLEKETVAVLYEGMAKELSTEVERKDDLLRVFVCREHACLLSSATLFVDLKRQRLSICWSDIEDKHDAWLSTDHNPILMEISECQKYEGFDLYQKKTKD